MGKTELMEECKKFGLPPSESKDANTQALLNFMDVVVIEQEDHHVNTERSQFYDNF